MERRAEVMLRVRVVPVAILGRGDARTRDRVPHPGRGSAALGPLLRHAEPRGGGSDRRRRPPVRATASARTLPGPVRRRRGPADPGAAEGLRAGLLGGAPPARGRAARNLLPPEQGPDLGRRRGGARHAPAAAAAAEADRVKLQIVHSTRYRYSGPIAESVMELRLRPMDGAGQRCASFKLELSSRLRARSYVDG